jgi:hypothetical protein
VVSGRIDKEFRPFVRVLKKVPGVMIVPPRKGNNHAAIIYNGKRVGGLPSSSGSVHGVNDLKRQLRQNGVPV